MNNSKVNLEKANRIKKTYWPATLYVEGQDQFRGWFNSSLITSVILTNQAPYQQVLTHGFTVDEKGLKNLEKDLSTDHNLRAKYAHDMKVAVQVKEGTQFFANGKEVCWLFFLVDKSNR